MLYEKDIWFLFVCLPLCQESVHLYQNDTVKSKLQSLTCDLAAIFVEFTTAERLGTSLQ